MKCGVNGCVGQGNIGICDKHAAGVPSHVLNGLTEALDEAARLREEACAWAVAAEKLSKAEFDALRRRL